MDEAHAISYPRKSLHCAYMTYLWPSELQAKRLGEQRGQAGAVTMLNLLKYRERANYEQARNEMACSGREAYKRYAEEVFPILETYNAKMVFAGAGLATVIGPEDEAWDDVLIVEYPSHDSFLQMSNSQAYKNISFHRQAALLDSRLISTDTNFSKYNSSI